MEEQENNQSFYVVIPTWLFDSEEIPDKAKKVYGVIASLCKKEGFCWARNSTLSQMTGIPSRTIRRHIKILEKFGVIEAEVEKGEGTTVGNQRKIWLVNVRNPNTPMAKLGLPLWPKTEQTWPAPMATSKGNLATFHNIEDIKDKYIDDVDEAKASEYVEKILGFYQKNIREIRVSSELKARVKKMLTYYSAKDILKIIDKKASDNWFMEHNARRSPLWFFEKKRLDKYLDEE